LFVELAEIRRQVKVMVYESKGIVVVGGNRRCGRCWWCSKGRFRWKNGAVMESLGVLAKGEYAAMHRA
jgi:hypothetical protein